MIFTSATMTVQGTRATTDAKLVMTLCMKIDAVQDQTVKKLSRGYCPFTYPLGDEYKIGGKL